MDDDEREAIRLQKILDKRLVLAAEALVEDWPVYLGLVAIQAIPVFFGGTRYSLDGGVEWVGAAWKHVQSNPPTQPLSIHI